MKMRKIYLIVVVLVFVAIYGCKKDNSSIGVNASLSFKVNGVAKSTNTISITNTTNPSEMVVLANLNTTESIYFTIKNPKIGSFDVSTGSATITYAADTVATSIYNGVAGTVTLTSYSGNTATGSFQFTGSNVAHSSLNITEGLFQTN